MVQNYSLEEIIAALKQRDRHVYRFLFEEYFERMVRFAEYFLLDRGEAEDIVQDIFLGVWNKHEVLDIQSNLKSWLFTQVRNRCLNRIKHLHVEDQHKQWLIEAQLYAEIPEVELDPELVRKVYRVIEQLPPQAREIFKRCVLEGKKYKEVAAELGISVNTVNTQMKRSYQFLRTHLGVLFLIFLLSV